MKAGACLRRAGFAPSLQMRSGPARWADCQPKSTARNHPAKGARDEAAVAVPQGKAIQGGGVKSPLAGG
jgi:hypothetical protein